MKMLYKKGKGEKEAKELVNEEKENKVEKWKR